MEPSAVQGRRPAGRPGSIENPEVHGRDEGAHAERVGPEEAEELAMPIDLSLETMSHLIDRQRAFQVVRGEGECAT